MARSAHKHFTIQGVVLTLWVIFMVLAHATIDVESQLVCPNIKYLAPNPGWSWRPNRTITVSLDSGWDQESDRTPLWTAT